MLGIVLSSRFVFAKSPVVLWDPAVAGSWPCDELSELNVAVVATSW